MAQKTTVTLRSKPGKKGYSLYLDVYHRGKRHTEFLGLVTARDYTSPKGHKKATAADDPILFAAKQRQRERLAELLAEPTPLPASLDFVAYMKQVAEFRKNNNALYAAAAASIARFQENKPLSMHDITMNWIDRYILTLKESLSINTVIHYLNAANLTMKEAVKDDLIRANIFTKYDLTALRRQREDSIITYLTIEEIERLAACHYAPNPMVCDAFLFACFTGLRISDTRSLTWGAIRGNELHISQIKTGGANYLPLSESALHILSGYERGANDERVFPTLPTRPGIAYALNEWAKMADVTKHLHFHVARHTYGTLLAASGTSANTLRTLLGHKSTNSSQLYVHIVDKTRANAVATLPVISRQKPPKQGEKSGKNDPKSTM